MKGERKIVKTIAQLRAEAKEKDEAEKREKTGDMNLKQYGNWRKIPKRKPKKHSAFKNPLTRWVLGFFIRVLP